jgi:hypothetical protein
MPIEGGRCWLVWSKNTYLKGTYLKNNEYQRKYLSIFDYFLENIRSGPVHIFGSRSVVADTVSSNDTKSFLNEVRTKIKRKSEDMVGSRKTEYYGKTSRCVNQRRNRYGSPLTCYPCSMWWAGCAAYVWALHSGFGLYVTKISINSYIKTGM